MTASKPSAAVQIVLKDGVDAGLAVDISKYVRSLEIEPLIDAGALGGWPDELCSEGLKRVGPITLSGFYDAPDVTATFVYPEDFTVEWRDRLPVLTFTPAGVAKLPPNVVARLRQEDAE